MQWQQTAALPLQYRECLASDIHYRADFSEMLADVRGEIDGETEQELAAKTVVLRS